MTEIPADDIDIAASYSRRDAAVVVPILDALKARGVRVWFDKNIPGGALWEETITRNMRRARAVIFFASKDSLESDRCFDEVSAARTLRKPIIPVLVEPVRMPDDLPDRLVLTLQTRNTVDAWPGAEGDAVDAIMRALAAFGVRGEPTMRSAPPAVGAAPPAQENAAKPRAEAPPAARRAGGRGWLFAGLGVVVAAAALAGGLFAGGVFKGGLERLQVTDAEWCSLSAPQLLAKGVTAEGMPALVEAANAGDRDAQTLHCLSANKGCTGGGDTTANMTAAYAACEQAGARGSWRAVFNQGWLKQRGCGVRIDGPGAVTAYTRSAEAGCAIAQFYLGTLYLDAELVGYDEVKGIKWLTASADQNYAPALNRLGAAYALGRGVPEDDVRGTEYYRRAAELGDPRAMINYARALEQGVGVEKNTGAAIVYYRRAAEQSDDQEIKQLAQDSLKRLGASS
ncbi:MAG: toll/interleukin-1 receptor domain-containing protein [Alphaproteobacteria bacterium]|nr:toll/interleukin-1 receptor domain-containing protein [Alphaproteobacteria bacterium]